MKNNKKTVTIGEEIAIESFKILGGKAAEEIAEQCIPIPGVKFVAEAAGQKFGELVLPLMKNAKADDVLKISLVGVMIPILAPVALLATMFEPQYDEEVQPEPFNLTKFGF